MSATDLSLEHPLKRTSLSEEIAAQRIVLRKHQVESATSMFAAIDHDRERLRRFLPFVDMSKAETDTLDYLRMSQEKWESREQFSFSMFLKDGAYIGNIGVHDISWDHRRCEVGYWIIGEHEGKGCVSEALHALEDALFAIGFNRIEIHCSSSNVRSSNVPRRCGYQLDGTLRQDAIENGEYRDTLVFSKLRSDRAKS